MARRKLHCRANLPVKVRANNTFCLAERDGAEARGLVYGIRRKLEPDLDLVPSRRERFVYLDGEKGISEGAFVCVKRGSSCRLGAAPERSRGSQGDPFAGHRVNIWLTQCKACPDSPGSSRPYASSPLSWSRAALPV